MLASCGLACQCFLSQKKVSSFHLDSARVCRCCLSCCPHAVLLSSLLPSPLHTLPNVCAGAALVVMKERNAGPRILQATRQGQLKTPLLPAALTSILSVWDAQPTPTLEAAIQMTTAALATHALLSLVEIGRQRSLATKVVFSASRQVPPALLQTSAAPVIRAKSNLV